MIVLITGLPGNGKTLYALDWVKRKADKEQRPVFYARIKGLTLPWTLIDPFEWDKCPANAIVVIDEVQQANDPTDPKSPSLFGVRQRGAVVPPWAAALETHRHKGIDLVLITQDPMLMDVHDRKLVGMHFHVKRVFGLQRATVHEFGGCRCAGASPDTVTQTATRGGDEVAQAQTILDAFAMPENAGKGAIQLNGRMVELLHAEMARRVVALARAIGN